jgi:hypothetical protein
MSPPSNRTGFRPDAATTAHGPRLRDKQTGLDYGTGLEYYRQIGCGTISFVDQHFYHVARLVYISVSRVGRTVATDSSDAAASRRVRHHDSGIVPSAGATPYCPAAPSHVCLQHLAEEPYRRPARRDTARRPRVTSASNIWQHSRPATTIHGAGAVATHFRHCDVLTLNSSAAHALSNGFARSRSDRASSVEAVARGVLIRGSVAAV